MYSAHCSRPLAQNKDRFELCGGPFDLCTPFSSDPHSHLFNPRNQPRKGNSLVQLLPLTAAVLLVLL